MKACVLLPALNEADHIGDLVGELRALRGLSTGAPTVLVIDDGSKDATADVARAAGAEVVSHPRNRGVGAAFRTGVEWVRARDFDLMAHMDSDGQVLPADLPLLLEPVAAGACDLAIGSRFAGERPDGMAGWKQSALTGFARGVSALMGHSLRDLTCGYRCMNRKVIAALHPTFDYDYITESLVQAAAAGARICEVPVTVLYPPDHGGMSRRVLRYSSRLLGTTAYAYYHGFVAPRFRR